MHHIKTSHLFIYPIKSTKGIELEASEVQKIGLQYDRTFAVINQNDQIITGRDNQALLKITANINDKQLELRTAEHGKIELPFAEMKPQETTDITIFYDGIKARKIDHQINEWLSAVANESVSLVTIAAPTARPMKPKHNGQVEDYIALNDAAPVHLVMQASVDHLNTQLEHPVTFHRFRPNIVVEGGEPYAEESWETIRIGECVFEVTIKTSRCNFITIDPRTLEVDQQHEPLRTLSKLKMEDRKINFGMYLIPRQLGVIRKGDWLEIEYK